MVSEAFQCGSGRLRMLQRGFRRLSSEFQTRFLSGFWGSFRGVERRSKTIADVSPLIIRS